MEQQRLNALVFVKYNINLDMRLQKRKDKGETYDPICLSDMESDDEWITETEDACLPGDVSWMDIHECFKEDEGTSNNKRKRGKLNTTKSLLYQIINFLKKESISLLIVCRSEDPKQSAY